MLKAYLAKQIELPTADASSDTGRRGGGIGESMRAMASKCNIM